MCWMCDRKYYSDQLWMGTPGLEVHVQAAEKFLTAFPVDGVGDLKPPVGPTGLIVTPDEAGGGKDVPPGNPVLTVGATHTIATINTIGDEDFYQVTLTAGTTYEIGQYAYFAGPNGAHLTDPYVELYAADGTTLIVSADGGANTPYNDANSGFDVLLTYTPDVTGTYYVNARAFSNSPATDNGDSVGDYELFVRVQDPNDPDIYHPYYEPDEPLYAIDWGTQVNKVNQSARNPDGNEGTRDTGNAQGTPVYGSALDIPALAAAQGKDVSGKNVITIYFAKPGDVFVSNDPTNPGLPPATITAVAIQDFEYTAVWTSLGEFEEVADIVYLEVQDQDDADFIYTSYQGTPGPGVSLLGSMSPPDESDEGLAQFNSGDERWNARDLAQGGFSFVTLIHEFGHGHGLAHPHDNGGHSGIMRGVEEESPFNYTTGDYELNQGVFTMMSYEDGWQSSPYGNASTTAGYGYLGGLSPFDIAAIQDKYGVNESYNTGDDIYLMKDVNAAGTFYSAIWDGGGSDSIVYIGDRDANIDLRAASLIYDYGGGGWVSYAFGIYGGFTIANGVTIENATSGSGDDTLTGNDANNALVAGAGNDNLIGGLGHDFLDGGAGVDAMAGGLGDDIYYATSGDTITEAAGQGFDSVYTDSTLALAPAAEIELLATQNFNLTDPLALYGSNFANKIVGNNGHNYLVGGGGNDHLVGLDGIDVLDGGVGADVMEGGAGDDIYYVDTVSDVVIENAGGGFDSIYTTSSLSLIGGVEIELLGTLDYTQTTAINLSGNEFANKVVANNGNNHLYGLAGNDNLVGLAGQDFLDGGAGTDVMEGGTGDDIYYVDNGLDVVLEVGGAGNDAVYSSTSYSLASGAEVELLGTLDYTQIASLNLSGNEYANKVVGNNGANALVGLAGNDYLVGLDGNDTLDGGAGIDVMEGGGGADTFRFTDASHSGNAAADILSDFLSGTDKIDLSGIDANSNVGGDQAFTFLGTGAFTNQAGQLRYDVVGNQVHVYGDTDGNGAADLHIVANSTTTIVSGDFMF